MSGDSEIGLVNEKSKKKKVFGKFWKNDKHIHLNPISVCYSDIKKTFYGLSCVSSDVESQMGTEVFLHKMTLTDDSEEGKLEVVNCKDVYDQCKITKLTSS